ncbi:ABC transporter substrate-binding protein [Halobaculum gomorrense]|uniref:Amino acid/amide ABC transporter substrate-binding protein, HAAT family n=1 Tax=Halobaculum gomorrense TaxID=43928 RepID=A0A1M5V5V0_9EURY|nr:ABC transporter substrate-binding protein [Halobaculum gomorrense]SHH70637.1 amino acid/amide ABC transporter substrate-binding protein, HAAT family [Halobaculum gomorrense]
MARKIDRRDVLKGAGTAGVVGLAGCITQNGSGGDTGGGGGETGDTTDSGMETTEGSGGSESMRTVMHSVLMPVTGDLASLGGPIRDGGTLPVKQLRAAGDMPVEFDQTVEDTQTDPQAGIQAANALANAGYPTVCGPASSGVNLQVTQQVLIPNGMVGCSPSSTSPNVTTLDDNDLIFRTAPSDALQGQVMAQVSDENLGHTSAAVMYVNNDYGQALADSFTQSFENNHGGTVQQQVAFTKEKSSYTSELSTAMNGSPGMLVVIGYPASGIQIFRDYYANYSDDTDILVTDGLVDPTLPENVGNNMSNVYATTPQATGPGQEEFASLYEEEYGRAPGVFNAHAYDASAVCLLANVKAGTNDGSVIKEEMRPVANPSDGGTEITPGNLPKGLRMVANGEDVYYSGASSSVNFDENGDMTAVTYAFLQYNTDMEGNIETLSTIDFQA